MSVQEVNFFAGEQNLYGGYQYEGLNLRGSISTRGSIRGDQYGWHQYGGRVHNGRISTGEGPSV